MSSNKSWGDLLDIKYVGFYCPIILRPYAGFGNEIYFPIEQLFQLVSQIDKLDTNRLAKADHYVDVTFSLKVGSDNRSEQADRIDVVLFK